MKPQMQPIASSMIQSVGYDPNTFQLYVQFHSGATWEYDDVPEDVYEGLVSRGGSFFHSNIKNTFDGREV